MKKIIVSLIVVLVVIVGVLLFVRNEHIDRFNPLLKEETSYAKVPKNTSQYNDIVAYNSEGKPLKYKLDFTGYDENNEYVKIFHKGKYIRLIEYLENDVPKFLK